MGSYHFIRIMTKNIDNSISMIKLYLKNYYVDDLIVTGYLDSNTYITLSKQYVLSNGEPKRVKTIEFILDGKEIESSLHDIFLPKTIKKYLTDNIPNTQKIVNAYNFLTSGIIHQEKFDKVGISSYNLLIGEDLTSKGYITEDVYIITILNKKGVTNES